MNTTTNTRGVRYTPKHVERYAAACYEEGQYVAAEMLRAYAAAIRQNPERGVTEAMVEAMTEAWFAGYAMHRDSPIPEDAWSYGVSRAEAEAFAHKYIAALSAPEPAAQGEIGYFSADPAEGWFNKHKTLADAVAGAESLLESAQDDASDYGWQDEPPQICYGVVLGGCVEKEGSRRPAPEGSEFTALVDYRLTAPPAQPAEPAAQGDRMPVPCSVDRTHPNKACVTLGFYSEDACDRFYKAITRGKDLFTAPPAQPAERVPEGWVLVPREPTDAMRAAFRADSPSLMYFTHTTLQCADFDSRYRAMLTASTAPSEGGKEVEFCSVCRKPFGPTETRVGTGDGTMRANNGRGSFAHRHCYEAAAQQAAR